MHHYMRRVIERDSFTQAIAPMILAAKGGGATARTLTGAFINALAISYCDDDLKEASASTAFVQLLASEGGSVDAKSAAKLYGRGRNYSGGAVRKAARSGRVIAIRDGHDKLHFPVWQFAPRGGTVPGLKEALAILAPRTRLDDLAAVTFFLNKTARLDGHSPIEALRVGSAEMIGAVKLLAVEYAE